MDESSQGLPAAACTGCAGTRLGWRVRRQRTGAGQPSRLSLVWTCRGCGAGWEEPLSLGAGPGAEMAAAA